MDNLTPQFISLAKRILNEFREWKESIRLSLTAIQAEIRSIRHQQETANQRQRKQREQPIALTAELQIPKDVQRDRSARDDRQYRAQKWLAFGTWLAFLAAAIYAGVNYKMLSEMRRANKAANESFAQTLKQMQAQTKALQDSANSALTTSETARAQLEASQRAWVAVVNPPVLQPTKNGITWTLRNFGGSPAFHISARGVTLNQSENIASVQDKICRDVEPSTGSFRAPWEILFPNQTGRPRAAYSIGAPISYLIGCVRYNDQFSHNRWTRFCYEEDVRNPPTFIACFDYNSTDADKEAESAKR